MLQDSNKYNLKKSTLIIAILLPLAVFSQTGPGGVGTADGTSNLSLWLDATTIAGLNDGDPITTWEDQSENGYDAIGEVDGGMGAVEPIYSSSNGGTNSRAAVTFNKSEKHWLKVTGNSEILPTAELTVFCTANFENSSDDWAGMLFTANDDKWDDGWGIAEEMMGMGDDAGGTMAAWVNDYQAPGCNLNIRDDYGTDHIGGIVFSSNDFTAYKSEDACSDNEFSGPINYNSGGINSNRDLLIGKALDPVYLTGDIEEIIIYDRALNDAERIIVSNYLKAKYGMILNANDVYDEDDNEGYYNDEAGVGQAANGSDHTDAQGTGWIRINTLSGLNNGEFLMWGHNNAALTFNTADVPSGTHNRINRQWSVSENGGDGVGTVTLSIDCSNFIIGDANHLQLLIDNDDSFTDASAHTTGVSCNSTTQIATFTNVDFSDNDHFTLVSSSSRNVLGGIYFSIASGAWDNSNTWALHQRDGNACSCHPTGSTNNAVISNHAITMQSDLSITNLKIETGGTLTYLNNNVDLSIAGSWLNNGTFNSLAGSVKFNGNSDQAIGGDATTSFYNLTINNTAGGVSLTFDQDFMGTLTLSTGNFTTTGHNFTIVSNRSGTGRIAEIASGASITGNITMQRYFALSTDGSGAAWRELTACIEGASVNDWQDNLLICGFSGASSQGCGEFISAYYFDESLDGGTSTGGWQTVASSTQSTYGLGVSVYVADENFTLDVTGPPITGAQIYNSSSTPKLSFTDNYEANDDEDGWSLLGNPFPSSLNWNKIEETDKVNIDNTIYTYNNAAGNYGAFTSGMPLGTNVVDGIITSGQAFWVHANDTNPSLTFRKEHKDDTDKAIIKSNKPLNSFLKLSITGSANSLRDEMILMFNEHSTVNSDKGLDALKMYSFDRGSPSISSVTPNGTELSINYLPDTAMDYLIPLRVKVGTTGTYSINVEAIGKIPTGVELILIDMLTEANTDLKQINSYDFYISDTTSAPRMFLKIKGTDGITVDAKRTDKDYFQLYPNPNSGTFLVELAKSNFDLLVIRDINGKSIQRKNIEGRNKVKVHINEAGVYFLTLSNKSESIIRRVVIE